MTVDKALYILFRRQGSALSRCFVETPPSVSVCIHKLSGLGYNGAGGAAISSRGISHERHSPEKTREESNDESTVGSDTILNDGTDHSQNGGASYDELKAAARRTGDAAKEWMTGASCSGSSVYKAARSDSENLFVSTKRAVEEGFGPSARESGKSPADSNAGVMDKIRSEAEESIHTAKEKLQGSVSTTAKAVQHGIEVVKDQVSQAVAQPSTQRVPSDKESARAEWERTRPANQQAEENADRKSQLTDAAHGDEPQEAVQRKDKQITPEQFYTRH